MTHSCRRHDSLLCETWLTTSESCLTQEWVMSPTWMSHVHEKFLSPQDNLRHSEISAHSYMRHNNTHSHPNIHTNARWGRIHVRWCTLTPTPTHSHQHTCHHHDGLTRPVACLTSRGAVAAPVHAHPRTPTPTHKHRHTHARAHTDTVTRKHTHTHTHIYTHIHTHTQTHTLTRTNTHTHTHTDTHIHSLIKKTYPDILSHTLPFLTNTHTNT